MLPTITRRSFRPFYMPNFFDDDFFPVLSNRTSSMPAVNIREDEKNYFLILQFPGLTRKILKLTSMRMFLLSLLKQRMKHEENRDGYKRKEFSYSSFCRSFYIPENVNRDKIEANYKDGILTVCTSKTGRRKNQDHKGD